MSSLVDGMDNLAVATAVVVDGAAPTGTIAGSADLRTCGGTLLVEVLQGKDLVAKDRGFMRSGKSDPFCKVTVGGRPVGNGKTKVVPKTLNPTWNWTGTTFIKERAPREIVVACYDKDTMSDDDPMGTVTLQLAALPGGTVTQQWFPVETCPGCSNATGQIKLAITFTPKTIVALEQGRGFGVDPGHAGRTQIVGLGWTGAYGAKVDLDASCVFFDARGAYLDALYFGNTACYNGAAIHSGDARTGEEALGEDEADERLEFSLARLPSNVASMLFVVTAYQDKSSFGEMKSCFVGLWDPVEGELCRYTLDCKGPHTALAMCRLARAGAGGWVLNAIGDVAQGPRDYGTWLPELKGYLKDIAPGVRVGDVNDKVAIMRKGGLVDISQYLSGPLLRVAMGLAWDITKGRSIDLDASAILLGPDLACREIVYFNQLKSRDGTVCHSGDDRSGDGGGDDEIITVQLDQLPADVVHVAFVVCSYSGQHFTNVDNTKCRLFVPGSPGSKGNELAKFSLVSKQYDCTGLVMAILSRVYGDGGSWTMRACGEGCSGRVAKDCVDEVQEYIQTGKIVPRR